MVLVRSVAGCFLVAFLPIVTAGPCQLQGLTGPPPKPTGKECMNQGAGDWTFGMKTSMTGTGLPTSEDGDPNGSFDNFNGLSTLSIFDEGCTRRATYDAIACGQFPWIIEENFLTQVLTLSSVDTVVGDAYFSFNYGNGKYSIGNDHCVCESSGSGLTGTDICRCEFPVNGIAHH